MYDYDDDDYDNDNSEYDDNHWESETFEDRIESEVERRKSDVGMAPEGSDQYYRNAYYILSAYPNPNQETRDKLDWLKSHGYDR